MVSPMRRKSAGRLRQELKCGPVQVVGAPEREVRRVALVCGAGGEFLKDAVAVKADVLLTGEMRFHDCLHAEQVHNTFKGSFKTNGNLHRNRVGTKPIDDSFNCSFVRGANPVHFVYKTDARNSITISLTPDCL